MTARAVSVRRIALVVPVPAEGRDEPALMALHAPNLAQARALAELGVEVHVVIDGPAAGPRSNRSAPGRLPRTTVELDRNLTLHLVAGSAPDPGLGGLGGLGGPARAPGVGPRGAFSTLPLVARALRVRPDVLHLFHLLSVRTLLAASPAPCRVFSEYNGGVVPASRLRRLALRAGAARLSGVFFSAPELAEPFVEARLVRRSAVMSVPEVTSVLPDPTAELRARARAARGLAPGDLLVLAVGRLDAEKDPLTVLRAFAQVAEVRPRAKLLVAAPSGALRETFLAHVAASRALTDRVELAWARPHAELPGLYAAADVFIHASRREILGYAFVEALQAGLPAAVCDIPAFRAGGRGAVRLCPPGDADAFAEAILELSADAGAGARSRSRFEAALSAPAIARRKLALYRGERVSTAY